MTTSEPLRRRPEQDRSRRRVEAVLDAALELVAERGTAPVTMTDVAARSGMSLTALYRYFPDRTAVVRALVLRMLEQDRAAVQEGLQAGGTLEQAVRRLVGDYRERDRRQPARAALRVAAAADRELALLDVADSRTNAEALLPAVQELTGHDDPEVLLRSLVLLTHLAESAVHLASLLDDPEEGTLLVEDFVQIVVRTLEHPAGSVAE